MYEALNQLAGALSHRWPWAGDPIVAASTIRQIHIATGCSFSCAHCFASPSQSLFQMDLDAFAPFAAEIRAASMASKSRAPFLFLGSETDPSMVQGYAHYLETWINSQMDISRVWIFTHGWQLCHVRQREEMNASVLVASQYLPYLGKVMLSVDAFSLPARRDWEQYLQNCGANLRLLLEALPIGKVGMEVLYPLEAPPQDSPERLSYWKVKEPPSYDMIEDELSELRESPGTLLTLGVITIGRHAGVPCRDFLGMIKDCGYPFNAGRARRFYSKGRNQYQASRALLRQRMDVLHPLEGFPSGFEGVMIYPDGRVRLVDYLGYRVGGWLNHGQPVITSLAGRHRTPPWFAQ